MTPTEALRQAIYYLDRELAPRAKIRAFSNAIETVRGLDDNELMTRAQNGTMTELEGIGPSTGEVITAALLGQPSSYLAKLDERSRIVVDQGSELRAALKGDCHSHSTWSDGGAAIADMARAAQALGHEYLVVTDHSPRLTIAHGLTEERLLDQIEQVAELNAHLDPFRILTGIEVDIMPDGTLDLPDTILERLDVVVASVHSKFHMEAELMTRRMVLAVANPNVDILGHITNRKVVGGGRRPSEFDADMVFAACAKFDTAVEINCRPERQDPPEDLLELALQWECKVAINTDAHAPGQLEWQVYGCDKASRLGIETADIINTWSAQELLAWTA